MKIVADQNIPEVAQAFADLGDVELLPGREIKRDHLLDCQCLIVRTVTRVDQALLADTPVAFVGSATIGTDHIDLKWLAENNIGFSNAAGCNAEAASEYVISGFFALSAKLGFDPFKRKAGIIGFGNVGSRLKAKFDALGIECLVNDPLLQHSGASSQGFVDLDTILNDCDLISLHTPLTRQGEFPSYHLFNQQRLQRLRQGCLLINAARGEVIDNAALLAELNRRPDLHVFLDTWENEPNILRELLTRVDLATPHIAGYSVEGRLRGTQMMLDAACAHFVQAASWNMHQLLPTIKSLDVKTGNWKTEFWQNLLLAHCDIWRDHRALVNGSELNDDDFAQHFDGLRRVYHDRLEYERFKLAGEIDGTAAAIARRLQFQIN